MINRIKTDKELVREAASKLSLAWDVEEYEQACRDMVEVLQHTRDPKWWKQLDMEVV